MLNSSTLPSLLARLERASENETYVLAFDGDGTLWSGDVGEDFFHFAVERKLILDTALPALCALAQRFNVAVHDEPNAQASALFAAFEDGTLPEKTACEMMAWCYAGWHPAELQTQIQAALHERRLAERYYTPLSDVMTWARERGHRTVVISASPYPVVLEAAKSLGFGEADVAAGTPVHYDNLYVPELSYPLPYAQTKVDAIRRLSPDLPILAAFGDNVFDLEMLNQAKVPIVVRPKPVLVARMSELADCVLLA